MAGTRAGGHKAAAKNKLLNPDFYKLIGHKGGIARSNENRGFARDPELAARAGCKGAIASLASRLRNIEVRRHSA